MTLLSVSLVRCFWLLFHLFFFLFRFGSCRWLIFFFVLFSRSTKSFINRLTSVAKSRNTNSGMLKYKQTIFQIARSHFLDGNKVNYQWTNKRPHVGWLLCLPLQFRRSDSAQTSSISIRIDVIMCTPADKCNFSTQLAFLFISRYPRAYSLYWQCQINRIGFEWFMRHRHAHWCMPIANLTNYICFKFHF